MNYLMIHVDAEPMNRMVEAARRDPKSLPP